MQSIKAVTMDKKYFIVWSHKVEGDAATKRRGSLSQNRKLEW